MSNRTQLTAYGSPSDRAKLEELAKVRGLSQSEWLIRTIREAHAQLRTEKPS